MSNSALSVKSPVKIILLSGVNVFSVPFLTCRALIEAGAGDWVVGLICAGGVIAAGSWVVWGRLEG
jgi:hypothetical protein